MTLGGVLTSEQVRLRAVGGGDDGISQKKWMINNLKTILWQRSTLFTIQALTPIFVFEPFAVVVVFEN
jgi:hypothetical protein